MKVLMIVAHGWNTHWASCYGNEWVEMNQLDRFAAQSYVFDHHFCTHPTANGFQETVVKPIFSALQNQQVHSVHVSYSPNPKQSIWSTARQTAKSLAGINDWFVIIETTQLFPPWVIDEKAFNKHVALLDEKPETEQITPWPDPSVGELDVDDHTWERLRLSFATVVENFDRDIALIKQSFFPKDDPAHVVILTGSHGYPLGEHSSVGPHQTMLFNEEYHVPLLIQTANSIALPRRCQAFTTHLDLTETINTVFTQPDRGLLNPKLVNSRENVIIMRDQLTSVRTRDWSYVVPAENDVGIGLLFSQPDDRWEKMNLAQSQPGAVDDFTQLLKSKETTP